MPLYKYIAAARDNTPHEVLIEADNEKEALAKLRSRRLTPVSFVGEESSEAGRKGYGWGKNGIDTYEFTRELAPLLDAHIPLERALGIIADGAVETGQRDFVNALRQGLHEGKKFSELVRSHGSLFPSYYANLIESGEETGCLPEVVGELYKFMGESRELRDFIISSSIYPLVILTITLVVVVLLFTVFVPRFVKVFIDMGRELPPAMEFLVAVSTLAKWGWWSVPLAIFVIWWGLKQQYGERRLKIAFAKFQLRVPMWSRIVIDLEMCKYLRTLAILIANHVEIIRTVRISGRIIGNPVIAAEFDGIDRKLKGGEKLSAALAGNRFLPRGAVPMLRVGEESGSVGEMLARIAGNLESDTRLKIKRLLSLFEPAVIVFLALVVLIVVVSIFAAMMEINAISQGG